MELEYPVKTHGLVISIGQIKNFLGLAQTFKQLYIGIYRVYNKKKTILKRLSTFRSGMKFFINIHCLGAYGAE